MKLKKRRRETKRKRVFKIENERKNKYKRDQEEVTNPENE